MNKFLTLHLSLLLLVGCALTAPDSRANSSPLACVFEQLSHSSVSPEFEQLETVLTKLRPEGSRSGEKVKFVMGAVELGAIDGLETLDGKPLNVAAGGVSAVMNDIAKYYPHFMNEKAHADLTVVGILMDGISTKGMKASGKINVTVEGKTEAIGVYKYTAPNGVHYVFLDHPSFKRLTAQPPKGESVYTMRGADEIEEQKIWSAYNQAIAKVYESEKADVYVPHDNHASPASFYIHRDAPKKPISSKPLVHNERYVGHYKVSADNRDAIRDIWNLTDQEMDRYFVHGDHLLMLAPAVRVAEQNELFTAMSVADGSAHQINQGSATWPDYFGRVQGVTNGFGDENRPNFSDLLKPEPSVKVLRAEGITNPDVIKRFKKTGYQFGAPGEKPEETLEKKTRAKADFQKNMGLEVNPDKPLFVSFARMVHQKGMEFAADNIRHILDSGGQIVIGGPTGDKVGEAERERFLKIKAELVVENNPNARNFVFIDGAVKGHLKGLMLAGGDFFLIPSRYEPCGLTDCEALFHGIIPIAHDTGGLSKSKSTVLYHPPNEDDQGFALGQAITEEIANFRDRKTFQQRQLNAMKETFPIEKNFGKFMLTQRVEVYGKMIVELQKLVDEGKISEQDAESALAKQLLTHNEDFWELVKAIKMIHPDRRSPLMTWLVAK